MGPVSLVGNSEAAGGVVKHRGTLFAECCTGPVSLVGNSEAAGGVVKHRGTLFAECCTGPVSLVGNSEAAGGVVKHRGTLFAECCTAPMSLVGGFRGCRRRGGTPRNTFRGMSHDPGAPRGGIPRLPAAW